MELYAWTALVASVVYGILLLANGDQGSRSEPSYEVIEGEAGVEGGNLTCYNCYLSVHSNNCVTMEDEVQVPTKRCRPGEYFCKTMWDKVDGQLKTFERGCAKTCEAGCDRVEGLLPLENCQECCRTDLCNNHSAADSLTARLAVLPAVLTTVLLTATEIVD